MWPHRLLMVSPNHFDVTYAINPHMMHADGALKSVDRDLAHMQWSALYEGYKSHGLQVEVIEGQPNLPDMVFCANQMFPFLKNGKTQFVMSRMKSPLRQNEVAYFQEWLQQQNLEYYMLPEGLTFESMGDAVWNYETQEIYGGYGFRTDPQVYDWLTQVTETPVIRLHLVDSRFYHLDTALSILNADTALVVREAFSDESYEKLQMKFKNLWIVSEKEAAKYLAANTCSIDGRNVFVEKRAVGVQTLLRENGFRVHTYDTSEYLKAGGSIFCLKLMF